MKFFLKKHGMNYYLIVYLRYTIKEVMAKAKINEFKSSEIEIAELAKAIAHPARIKILSILTECNSCITGTIVDQLPLSQSTVSQHLAELKKAGLIIGEIDGPKTCYCLNPDNILKAKEAFSKLFSTMCKCC